MGTNVTHRKIIQELASFLYRNPETANNEFKACKKQVEILESMGFQVTVPYSSIPTSFRAEYKSPFAKNDCKTICFLSEYDALENMGHACGHHLIASAAFAGFLASVNLCETEKLNAKILLLGTPAEEGYGGKVQLLNAGAFENIDCCLITHPYYNTYLDSGTMAASRYKIKFLGKSSHAGNAPQDGVNALDSMITFFSSIGLYRQQMQKGNMVHGIITNGGTLPNIIPELTEAYFYLRSTANDKIEKLAKDFKRMLSCSASMHPKSRIMEAR